MNMWTASIRKQKSRDEAIIIGKNDYLCNMQAYEEEKAVTRKRTKKQDR